MEANLKEPISQGDLADYVGLSRRQLQRLFQKYLLCAPSRYYLQLRLHRARELLEKEAVLTAWVNTWEYSLFKQANARAPMEAG